MKEQENVTYNLEKKENQSIETTAEMTEMLEIAGRDSIY